MMTAGREQLGGSECRPVRSSRGRADVLRREKRKGQSLALAPASSSPVGSSERLAHRLRVLAVNRWRDGSEGIDSRQGESGQGRGLVLFLCRSSGPIPQNLSRAPSVFAVASPPR